MSFSTPTLKQIVRKPVIILIVFCSMKAMPVIAVCHLCHLEECFCLTYIQRILQALEGQEVCQPEKTAGGLMGSSGGYDGEVESDGDSVGSSPKRSRMDSQGASLASPIMPGAGVSAIMPGAGASAMPLPLLPCNFDFSKAAFTPFQTERITGSLPELSEGVKALNKVVHIKEHFKQILTSVLDGSSQISGQPVEGASIQKVVTEFMSQAYSQQADHQEGELQFLIESQNTESPEIDALLLVSITVNADDSITGSFLAVVSSSNCSDVNMSGLSDEAELRELIKRMSKRKKMFIAKIQK